MILTAEFLEPDSVAPAVSALLAGGFDRTNVEVFSNQPVHLPEGMHRSSWASLAAVAGAVLNGGLATAYMYYTQRDYPLITGGMPINSIWSTGVISFEMTMAGAVAGTVLALLWEAGLLRRRRETWLPALREGSIFLQVRCADERAPAAADCLSRGGAIEIVRHKEPS
jgi:hypothetical protein